MSERASLLDALACAIGRPRRIRPCRTCDDGGMLEDDYGREDVCPDCEGGIWREPEAWRWYIHRQSWLGWRIDTIYSGWHWRLHRDWPA